MSTKWKGIIFGDVIKFMPLGFWCVWDQPIHIKIPLQRLFPRKDFGYDELHQAVIDCENIPHQYYPEIIEDYEMFAYSDRMTSVAERK